MTALELLAPARNKDIGVAAINCGADAVYIAGPDFGARKAAGNSADDIRELCTHAHKFGARIFVTFNIEMRDDELEEAHRQMLRAQEAGADAFIIRDPRIVEWEDITVPLHASTQCGIRDVQTALYYESIGCSRIILERELSLETIREICAAVQCEVEFFVHGALCVCYSGDCRLSEFIDGRSADRGECIQACRSLYDLIDANGKTLIKGKALLSLKDYNLKNRLEELADAGICSFKIEGRLKNASYVKNVVRDYDLALNNLIEKYPQKYCRASFGHVSGGFEPDTAKTFNRGYIELFLDGKKGKWSSMDAPKSMGEAIGTVRNLKRADNKMEFRIEPINKGLQLKNGDGFAFATRDGVTGFRGDVCSGLNVSCKNIPDLREGTALFRNINSAFEKTLESAVCTREIGVCLNVQVRGKNICIDATTEDGRKVSRSFPAGDEAARNAERAQALIREQLSKRAEHYSFRVESLRADGELPLLSAAALNGMRRSIAEDINRLPCSKHQLLTGRKNFFYRENKKGAWLMRSKYCIKYELGLCPVHQGAPATGQLLLVNNGRRFPLEFDCSECEMKVMAPCRK